MRKIDPERVARQRGDIIAAAMRCFARLGVQRATTDDICREAGISPGRLYYYFPSRDAVVEAVARDFYDYTFMDLPDALARGDFITSLRAHQKRLQAKMEEHGMSAALALELISQSGRIPQVRAVVQEGSARRIEALREALESRKRGGMLAADADVESLTRALSALISGIEVLSLTDPDYDLARYQHAAEALLRPWMVE